MHAYASKTDYYKHAWGLVDIGILLYQMKNVNYNNFSFSTSMWVIIEFVY